MSSAVARVRFTADDDIVMNAAAVKLMFGVEVADPNNPDAAAVESGRRRRVRYQNLTGTADPDIINLLTFYAQQENVTLILDTGRVERTLHAAIDMDSLPDRALVVDETGALTSVVDIEQLQADATRLMYAFAATAGDDEETDRVATKWASEHDPEYFGYLAAAALSFMTRLILAPTLDAAEAAGLDLRIGLLQAARNAEHTLGKDGVQ
ncbi:hypothetical protein SEA_CASHLINE_46 [Gordonia phage Cashline]|nr:hypothetical protein SEA_CASHLINE_46 [Gordonia phage Cashline]